MTFLGIHSYFQLWIGIPRHLQQSKETPIYQQPSEEAKASINTRIYNAQHMESCECLVITIMPINAAYECMKMTINTYKWHFQNSLEWFSKGHAVWNWIRLINSYQQFQREHMHYYERPNESNGPLFYSFFDQVSSEQCWCFPFFLLITKRNQLAWCQYL